MFSKYWSEFTNLLYRAGNNGELSSLFRGDKAEIAWWCENMSTHAHMLTVRPASLSQMSLVTELFGTNVCYLFLFH